MVKNKIENYAWRWCLVGSIVDKRFYGEEHEIKSGIKLFSPSTKEYIAPHQWGDDDWKECIENYAKDVNKYAGIKTKIREYLARTKVFVDFVIGKEPKFGGEKIEIK